MDLDVETAFRLKRDGLSDRKIAAALKVGRTTVRRYLTGT